MAERKDKEDENGDKDKPGILDRVGAAAGAARQSVQRSAEVMTGADIRKFEDFTEAATTAVVGVHQDQAELREQLVRTEQSLHALQQDQTELREKLAHTEQSLHALEQRQTTLKDDDIAQVKDGPSPWVVASGAVSIVALALGILALLT